MPFDGSGVFTRSYNWVTDKNNAIKITASRMDGEFDNFAAALNQLLLRSGVVAMTGDLRLGGNKITGLASGVAATPALSPNVDATTGMWFPSAGQVAFSTGGTERLRCLSTGVYMPSGQSLGIGQLTPRANLDVAGTAAFRGSLEDTLVSSTAITGTVNIDFYTQPLIMYTANAAGNWTFNIRGNSGATLNSIMSNNQTLTCVVEVPQGATAYYCTAITIDGAAPAATKWANGGAPTAGNVSGVDVYMIRVTKISSGVFQVRACVNQEK